MRKLKFSIMITVLFTLLSCAAKEQSQYPPAGEDIRLITQLFDSVMTTARNGDLEAYLALYADDAIWMLHDRLEDAGKEEVRPYYSWISNYSFDQVLTLNEIQVAGDWAFVRFTADGWIIPKPGVDEEKERVISRHFTIVSRQKDESWKLARDMFINPSVEDQ
jgi:uncharacterized protein (TIGR02246 family)